MTNSGKSIISNEYKNQQPIENDIPLYSTMQYFILKTKQTDIYSTLDKPNDLQDSEYSSLGPR